MTSTETSGEESERGCLEVAAPLEASWDESGKEIEGTKSGSIKSDLVKCDEMQLKIRRRMFRVVNAIKLGILFSGKCFTNCHRVRFDS